MRLLIVLCLLLFSSGAQAEWLQSSSAHFVVYANDSETNIRRLSEQLERYDAAMAKATGIVRELPSPSNRVTVYVVNTVEQVQKLAADKNVGGFYIPRAGGSLAIIPPVTAARGEINYSMIVLLHEYAHHFLISSGGGFLLPRWTSEGAAEFFASASFESDGSVGLGQPANHRAAELTYAADVTVKDLLDPDAYEKRKSNGDDSFYGKSWLLYHYLMFSQARAGQLARYAMLLTQGKSSREAGLEAFGDFAVLEHELDKYLAQPRLKTLMLPAAILIIGPVDVRKLSAGEAAMMPIRIRSRRGVNREQATALLPKARAIAARFPNDPYVLSGLAEAEYDAGNDGQALDAANAALTIDRTQVNAYYQKGKALLRMADKAEDKAAAFNAARAPFLALNRLENNHPVPLIYYYESFVRQGVQPPARAISGLQRAVELAPFDLSLHMTLAVAALKTGQRDLARINLMTVAVSPHGDKLGEAAQAALKHMESDPDWDGGGMTDAMKEEEKE